MKIFKNNKEIRKVLMEIGISSNRCGYHYIIRAVEILKAQRIHTNLGTLYEIIGKENDKGKSLIERDIRYAIQKAYEKSAKLKYIYAKKPNNSAFLYDLVFNFDIFKEV